MSVSVCITIGGGLGLFNLYAAFTQYWYLIFVRILQLCRLSFKCFCYTKCFSLGELILIHWCFCLLWWLDKNQDTLWVKLEKEILQHSMMKKMHPVEDFESRQNQVPIPTRDALAEQISQALWASLFSLMPWKFWPTFQVWDWDREQTVVWWVLSKHGPFSRSLPSTFQSPTGCPGWPSGWLEGATPVACPTLPWGWLSPSKQEAQGHGSGCASCQWLGTVELLFWRIWYPASCFSWCGVVLLVSSGGERNSPGWVTSVL